METARTHTLVGTVQESKTLSSAWQEPDWPLPSSSNVRFGSKAEVRPFHIDFRFTPESRHSPPHLKMSAEGHIRILGWRLVLHDLAV